jgi:transglutaminase-like putative cysteine protease
MKLRVSHLTRYEYTQDVAFSAHAVYLRPRETPLHRVARFSFNISPSAKHVSTLDAYDNALTWIYLWDRAHALSIRTEFETETLESNPFDFILRNDAIAFPFSYQPVEQLALAPFLSMPFDEHQSRMRNWLDEHFIERPTETLPFLTALNTLVYYTFVYRRRDDPHVQTPTQTLELGGGTSRDFAMLLVAICRALGLAARFVSGYLHTYPEDNRTSPGSMHAWTEVFLPGAGWKGFDATHGVLCTDAYIPVAHAPSAEFVSPVQGSFYSSNQVRSQLTTKVIVEAI